MGFTALISQNSKSPIYFCGHFLSRRLSKSEAKCAGKNSLTLFTIPDTHYADPHETHNCKKALDDDIF